MIDGYGSAHSVSGPSLPQTKIYAQVGRWWRVSGYASSAARAIIESGVRAKLNLAEYQVVNLHAVFHSNTGYFYTLFNTNAQSEGYAFVVLTVQQRCGT